MKQIERTFSKIVKKFIEPVKLRPLIYLKYFFVSFIRGINGIVHILFLERITFYLQNSDKEWFNQILKYYIIFIIIYEIVNFSVRKWWWVESIPLWVWDMYKKYLNKYLKLDNNKIETIWTGKLIWIIQSWIGKWLELLADFFEHWISLLVSFIFTVYMIVKVDFIYSIIFLWLFILFLIVSVYFNSKLIPFRKMRYKYRNSRLKNIVKVLMNKQEIMQSSKIDKETDNIYKYCYLLEKTNKDMWTYRQFMKRTSQLWMALILLFTFWFLWNEVLNWKIELNILVWLTWVLIIMQRSIWEAIRFYTRVTKDFIDIEKMWDFFDTTVQIKWYNTGKSFKYEKWKIKIENLSYGYIEWKSVFKNFDLEIKWGKVTAFVWNSGSWKSTLVKLISWYIRSDKWNIIIDEQKLNKTSLKSYYKNIGYLTQEPSVFDWSILDNLTYAIDRKLKKGELEEVLKQAKCEFIYDLQDWVNTEIWERWIRLSWGQRQRLAIAKIFLKDPKIIILDEPTSALDSFSEEQITKAMHNLFKWRTVIIIAHRLQTVRDAHEIILLENWEIKERWNHKELVKLKWQYSKMLDLQSGF